MKTIVLASSSPRRIGLLSRYNIDPIVIKAKIEEKILPGQPPEQVAMALAFQKANYVAKLLDVERIVIGADTIVACQGKILGKPKDEEEARKMLQFLSNKEHKVISGISIIKSNTNIKLVDFEKTLVKFRKLDPRRIENYIKTGESMGKAGGYAIQGLGGVLIEKIDGCYFNVMGLPLYRLDTLLEKHFDINLLQ